MNEELITHEMIIHLLQLNILNFSIDLEKQCIYYTFDVFGYLEDDYISFEDYLKLKRI